MGFRVEGLYIYICVYGLRTKSRLGGPIGGTFRVLGGTFLRDILKILSRAHMIIGTAINPKLLNRPTP